MDHEQDTTLPDSWDQPRTLLEARTLGKVSVPRKFLQTALRVKRSVFNRGVSRVILGPGLDGLASSFLRCQSSF